MSSSHQSNKKILTPEETNRLNFCIKMYAQITAARGYLEGVGILIVHEDNEPHKQKITDKAFRSLVLVILAIFSCCGS